MTVSIISSRDFTSVHFTKLERNENSKHNLTNNHFLLYHYQHNNLFMTLIYEYIQHILVTLLDTIFI